MRHHHGHITRYAALHRSALRKGYTLAYNDTGTWSLTHTESGEPSEAGADLSLDEISAFLMTRQLIG